MKRSGILIPFTQEIIAAYQAGLSVNKLAKQYKCDNSTVWNLLRRNGIEKRPLLLEGKEDEVVARYLSGDTLKEIGQHFAVSYQMVRDVLEARGVDRRPPTESSRLYEVDKNFFEVIDTPDKAYWLGMMYADGNVSKAQNKVQVKLRTYDQEILHKMRIAIGYEGPIRYEDNGDMACLIISCSRLKQQLLRLGCVPAKSLIKKFPAEDQVPMHLLRRFLTGYWDGNGCLHISPRSQMNIRIVSTKHFCDRIAEIIASELGLSSWVGPTNKNRNLITHTIGFGGNLKVKRFLEWLYAGATDSGMYMGRKYTLFLKGLENIKRPYKLSDWSEIIVERYRYGESLDELAQDFDVQPQTIKKLIIRETGSFSPNDLLAA